MPASLPWHLQPGVMILLGTADAADRPSVARASCARVAEDGRTMLVHIPVPEGLTAIANIVDNGRISVVYCRVSDYRSLQHKGVDARLVATAPEEERPRVAVADNIVALVATGVAPRILHGLWSPDTVVVAFTPTDAFDQTPGPHAGRGVPG